MTHDVPALVLFDLDGVLVEYDRRARVRHLADACGCSEARAWDVLFASGLEARFDAGTIATTDYLAALGDGLGAAVDARLWAAARGAGMRLVRATIDCVRTVATRADVAVLTNNGRLLVEQLPRLLPDLFPLLEARVLCSAALGATKPAPQAYLRAVELLGHAPEKTLFLDDAIANVDGARHAGLRAEHVAAPSALAATLSRYLPP